MGSGFEMPGRYPLQHERQGVGGLEGRHDAFGLGEQLEGSECLVIGHHVVAGTAGVLELCVLRTDARVVQPCGDAVALAYLSVLILQHVGAGAVQQPGGPAPERRAVLAAGEAAPGRLDTEQLDVVVEEAREQAERVAAAADARDGGVGRPAEASPALRAPVPWP